MLFATNFFDQFLCFSNCLTEKDSPDEQAQLFELDLTEMPSAPICAPVGARKVLSEGSSSYTHGVRTAADGRVPAAKALEELKMGNQRFVEGKFNDKAELNEKVLDTLATHGQNPMAAIIGCADSRCPAELIFDVLPGDIFVLRNAGNTLTCAEGSFIGSTEYCCGPLGTNLVLVLGHTKCGAIAGATKMMLASQGKEVRKPSKTNLESLLRDLRPVALKAQEALGEEASEAEIAAHAVRVNVIHTIDMLLTHSEPLREKVKSGALQVHGAIFDINTGKVEFLGESPNQAETLRHTDV